MSEREKKREGGSERQRYEKRERGGERDRDRDRGERGERRFDRREVRFSYFLFLISCLLFIFNMIC